MSDHEQSPGGPRPTGAQEELRGLLADAVQSLRSEPVDTVLVEQCRRRALESRPRSGLNRPSEPLRETRQIAVAAAMLLVLLNLGQAWARLPAADRTVAAVQVTPAGERLVIYSDLRVERVHAKPIEAEGGAS